MPRPRLLHRPRCPSAQRGWPGVHCGSGCCSRGSFCTAGLLWCGRRPRGGRRRGGPRGREPGPAVCLGGQDRAQVRQLRQRGLPAPVARLRAAPVVRPSRKVTAAPPVAQPASCVCWRMGNTWAPSQLLSTACSLHGIRAHVTQQPSARRRAKSADDARDTFKMLRSQGIGEGAALLYTEWAALEGAAGAGHLRPLLPSAAPDQPEECRQFFWEPYTCEPVS